MIKPPNDADWQIIHQKARELFLDAKDDKHLTLAIIFASSNLQAAASADCPNNPSKTLKGGLDYYNKNTRACFQRFIRLGKKKASAGKFDA